MGLCAKMVVQRTKMEISKGAQQAGGGEWEVLSGPEH